MSKFESSNAHHWFVWLKKGVIEADRQSLFRNARFPIDSKVMILAPSYNVNGSCPPNVEVHEVYGDKPVVNKVGAWGIDDKSFEIASHLLRRTNLMGAKIRISAINVRFKISVRSFGAASETLG